MSMQIKEICRVCGAQIMVNADEIRPLCPACKQVEKRTRGDMK